MYAKRIVSYLHESPLGVCYHRVAPRADGSPGDAQHWAHDDGGWDSEFDAARHVRPFDRPLPDARPNYQSFTPPLDVLEDDAAIATVHVLRQDGSIANDLDMISGVQLRMMAGGPIAVP